MSFGSPPSTDFYENKVTNDLKVKLFHKQWRIDNIIKLQSIGNSAQNFHPFIDKVFDVLEAIRQSGF